MHRGIVSFDEKVIAQAKQIRQKQNISLSKLIEGYLDKVSSTEQDPLFISPVVRILSGVLPLPKGYDYKKGYGDFLSQKYKVKTFKAAKRRLPFTTK
jgi:Family of unknown function (DUF6364)